MLSAQDSNPQSIDHPPKAIHEIIRYITRIGLKLLTRTSVTGIENIPDHGPLLILANHVSTLDPALTLLHLPKSTEFVGPSDFKLLFPANLIIKWYGLIPVKRSVQVERHSLKLMTEVLKSGKMLGLFPQGGTWEKPITDAKSGAAYLSMTTQSPILPIAIGGAYRVWDKVARLERPKLIVNIGKVMPPVAEVHEKSKRGAALDAATREIMQHIYDLLPPVDQAWYDDLAVRRYALKVNYWENGVQQEIEIAGGSVLAELVLKPNLISPLIHNAKLPLSPLLKSGVHFAPDLIRLAAESLQKTLHSSYDGYMEYRLGMDKSSELYAALDALIALTQRPTISQIAVMSRSYLP